MFDILSLIPGKKKTTTSHWHTFNAVCCSHRGHRPDKRMRAGIIFEGQNNWRYHCFNCGFTAGFLLGKPISRNTSQLLSWCGVDIDQIQRWSLQSLQQKDLLDFTSYRKIGRNIHFDEKKLPDRSELLSLDNPTHLRFIEYLENRGIPYDSYPFMITPNMANRDKDRIIIPFTYRNKIVGHTSRYLDNKTPKYISEQQQGYVFGIDFQKPNWEFCILVEGIFDALSISGCALGHNTINPEQIALLSRLNRRVIMVPDRDSAGLEICDRAMSLGYQVSLPEWEYGIKDVNDAVKKYGKLPTLLSIIQNATNSKIKIEIARKKIAKINRL